MLKYLKLFPAIRYIFFEEKSKKDAASIRAKIKSMYYFVNFDSRRNLITRAILCGLLRTDYKPKQTNVLTLKKLLNTIPVQKIQIVLLSATLKQSR